MLIPKYLQEISETIKSSKDTEIIKIKCYCKHSKFKVYESQEDNLEKIEPGFNEIIREDGKLFLVKRNLFGKIIERIECGDMFEKKQRKIIKLKCDNCGREYIVFDNYKYGYNAILTLNQKENIDSIDDVNFKLSYSQILEVNIKIYNDISFEELKEEFNELDYDNYLCSFSNIDIYGFNSKSRRIKIYSEETA